MYSDELVAVTFFLYEFHRAPLWYTMRLYCFDLFLRAFTPFQHPNLSYSSICPICHLMLLTFCSCSGKQPTKPISAADRVYTTVPFQQHYLCLVVFYFNVHEIVQSEHLLAVMVRIGLNVFGIV